MMTRLRLTFLAIVVILTAVALTPSYGQDEITRLLDQVRDATGHGGMRQWENGLYVTIGGNWLDTHSPLQLSLISGEQRPPATRMGVGLPNGRVRAVIDIDAESHLPGNLSWRIYDAESVRELKDYGKVGAFRFPHRLRISENGDLVDIRVEEVLEAAGSSLEAGMAIPDRPPDTSFRKDIPAVVEAKLTGRGILVRPRIRDHSDAWFILDSGAGCNVIDKRYARTLGMERFGKGRAIGVGGTVGINYRKGAAIELGPMEIGNPIFAELSLGYNGRSEARAIGGILGFDLFIRSVIEIDNEKNTVRVFGPFQYDEPGLKWQEILIIDEVPALTCRFAGGHEGTVAIDTGSPGSVALNREFVLRHALLEGRDVSTIRLEGVGGGVRAYEGRMEWLEIAGIRIQDPEVVFASEGEGVFGDQVTAGIIGRKLLSHFKLAVFDYPAKRIGFLHRVRTALSNLAAPGTEEGRRPGGDRRPRVERLTSDVGQRTDGGPRARGKLLTPRLALPCRLTVPVPAHQEKGGGPKATADHPETVPLLASRPDCRDPGCRDPRDPDRTRSRRTAGRTA